MPARSLALALLALLCAATPASGELRARTTASPWSLEFRDARGATVLAEAPGTGPGPTGRLGFATTSGWFHATRVTERRSGSMVLATSDPAGRTLRVRLSPAGRGVVALRAAVAGPGLAAVERVGIAFRARAAERYLGFGERSNAVDQRGNEVQNYVAEGRSSPMNER